MSADQGMNDLRQQLRGCVRGGVCFMGLGNIDYGDDGFGVRLAEELIFAGLREVVVAGTAPEWFIGPIADGAFEHLIFLDAVEFGGPPGAVVFLDAQEIAARFPQISTHKLSLAFLAQVAEANGTTRAWLLGVQPQSLAGQRLAPAVHTTLVLLRELIVRVIRDVNHQPTKAQSQECFSAEAYVDPADGSGSEADA